MNAQDTTSSRNTRDYSQRMRVDEKFFYIEKFQRKMTNCLPSTAAWWIDGINRGTESDMSQIFFEIRNEIDWVSPDPRRERGDMPAWYSKNIYDPKMGSNKAVKQLKDEENPALLFSTTWTSLLVQIAKGEVDAEELAKKELANRGLNNDGKWVGFNKAKSNTNYHYDRTARVWMYVPERDEE